MLSHRLSFGFESLGKGDGTLAVMTEISPEKSCQGLGDGQEFLENHNCPLEESAVLNVKFNPDNVITRDPTPYELPFVSKGKDILYLFCFCKILNWQQNLYFYDV